MPDSIDKKLIPVFKKIARCDACSLPKGYTPVLRPRGRKYEQGGIVFIQINPGHIGRLTDAQIRRKYKSKYSRSIVIKKASDTDELLRLQNDFIKKPTQKTYKVFQTKYLYSMTELWGWPPGKYGKTIEQHGVKLDSIAVINIAQCPIPDDKYSNKFFTTCWENWTYNLIDILQPSLIVAQGNTVYKFLQKQALPNNVKLVLGVHHASRQKNKLKEKAFREVKKKVNRLRRLN
jgi:hypothetical protein